MSVKVMSAVFERYPAGSGNKGRPGEMLLALALADVSRDDGVLMINDSVGELARKTRQTERGVQIQLRHMEAIGWLARTKASDGGRCCVSVYRINAAWIAGGELAAANADGAPSVEPACGTKTPNQAASKTPNQAAQNPELSSGAIEPLIPKRLIHPPAPQGGRDGSVGLITMKTWLDECKAGGVLAIPDDDPVWAFAEAAGLTEDLVALAWWVFKRKRIGSEKKQRGAKGWRQAFRNAVEGNWYRLWWLREAGHGVAELTTVGLQMVAARSAERHRAQREPVERGGVSA